MLCAGKVSKKLQLSLRMRVKFILSEPSPSASDRVGRDDPKLAEMNDLAFAPDCRMTTIEEVIDTISNGFVQDVRGKGRTVRALHRKAGFRDVYMIMDANPGTIVEFRAKGAVELWDPWTGNDITSSCNR